VTSREDVERRVDELAAAHSGKAFALAISSYAAELDPVAREELEQILLERAANVDQAMMERVDARGWFRRQWDKASGGR
jgi:hypothetical protein